jgi:hypothetical protein
LHDPYSRHRRQRLHRLGAGEGPRRIADIAADELDILLDVLQPARRATRIVIEHAHGMALFDAPKKLPGEYITDKFYTSQPMEVPRDMSLLESTFKCIKAGSQLLYSSGYPHWDFDLPSTIYDLPFQASRPARHPRRQCREAVQARHRRPQAR